MKYGFLLEKNEIQSLLDSYSNLCSVNKNDPDYNKKRKSKNEIRNMIESVILNSNKSEDVILKENKIVWKTMQRKDINIGQTYFSKIHGLCHVLGSKIHNRQFIIVVENTEGKSIYFTFKNFDKEFEIYDD